jgi:TonB family protein
MGRNFFLFLFALFALSGEVSAQAENSAPVLWERYKITEKKISIELPKMPVLINGALFCTESAKVSYFAYAGEAIYELTISSRSKLNTVGCAKVTRFNDALLAERLATIRSSGDMTEASGFEDGRQVYRFSGKTGTRTVISDVKNGRWLELAIIRREDVEAKDQRFFGSLRFAADRGKEIGIGSDVMLGDEGVALTPPPETVKDPNKDRAVIVVKPRAMYTEQARKTRTTGSVALRVALLANGGIGNIRVLKALPLGLTENAIAAAKKIVFLPVRVNGVPVSNVVTIEYGFSIY